MRKNNLNWWYALLAYGAFVLAIVLNSVLMSVSDGLLSKLAFDKGALFNLLMFVWAGLICLFLLRLVGRGKIDGVDLGFRKHKIFTAIFVGSILGMLFFGLTELIESYDKNLKEAGEQLMQSFNLGQNLVNDLLLILGIGLFAPVVEEIIFRGVIFYSIVQGLKKIAFIPSWLPLLLGLFISTFAFLSIHGGDGQESQLVMLALLSIITGLALYFTGSLLAAVFVHSINNNLVLLKTFLQQNNLELVDASILIFTSTICLFLCLPLLWLFRLILPKVSTNSTAG